MITAFPNPIICGPQRAVIHSAQFLTETDMLRYIYVHSKADEMASLI